MGINETLTLSKDQANAFLRSLWPEGDMSFLSNHARTFFEALIGDVPRPQIIPSDDPSPEQVRLAFVLRALADRLENGNADIHR